MTPGVCFVVMILLCSTSCSIQVHDARKEWRKQCFLSFYIEDFIICLRVCFSKSMHVFRRLKIQIHTLLANITLILEI